MIDIGFVLTTNFQHCDYTLVGNKYKNLEWRDKVVEKPTLEALESLWENTKNTIDAKEARTQRDALLSQSDWTQVPDAPVDQAAWAEYRQALRDVPQQNGFPTDITWPVKPE